MNLTWSAILLLLAFACFVGSTFGTPTRRVNLQSAGLALLAAALLVTALRWN